MTEPAIYADQYPAPPPAPATVPLGKLAELAGVTETWAMAGGYAAYPLADPAARPPALFRIYDPRDPREIMRVTDTRTAGSWVVARAAEGSLGVAHRPGFEVRPFLTAAGMHGLAAGVPSRSGIVLRPALTQPLILGGAADHDAIPLMVPGGEQIPGSVYEVLAWGFYTPGTPSSPDGIAAPAPHFNCAIGWGGNLVGAITFPVPAPAAGSRWRLLAAVNLYPAEVTGTINLWAASSADPLGSLFTPAALFGATAPIPANVTGNVTFRLRIGTGTTVAYDGVPGAASVTVQGARIGRGA
jgi:hypothetical protein